MTEVDAHASDRLAETVRAERLRIVATLARAVGDLGLAEDAVQDAAVVALREWPSTGVPDQPRAWLTVVARRRAIDLLRREQARTGKEREGVDLMELSRPDPPSDAAVRDDQLRLVFTCCHPALSPDARVALALRSLCGLSTAQVAAVLLTSEAAMAKRLTRTRQKIAVARIPYRVPTGDELPARLATVCAVVHALYTAGHAPLGGEQAADADACEEAVRLARLLYELLPDEPMPAALLALLLLTEVRRPARVDDTGELVVLAQQDRTRCGTTSSPPKASPCSTSRCDAPTASRTPTSSRPPSPPSTSACPRTSRRTGPRSCGSTASCSASPRASPPHSAGRSPWPRRAVPPPG